MHLIHDKVAYSNDLNLHMKSQENQIPSDAWKCLIPHFWWFETTLGESNYLLNPLPKSLPSLQN